ncbi:MAG TPA: proline dehydrogenase family protein [Candidatus Polarisedimenticolia bacterium]|nr:proline dehydrogenase family protein [Candidatus Polarisedimenticolia bacterium]
MPRTTTERPARPWDALPPGEGSARGGAARWIRSRLMRLAPRPLVRALARPYIAGETRAEAVALTGRLHHASGLHSTLDVLGEDIADEGESRAMLDEYLAILDDLGPSPHANISIKLSALGQALDEELCARHLETLLERASRYGQFVRFDMEDHTTTSSTLGFYRRFVGRYPRIGVVLQSRLHRTASDVRELAPLRPNVRLCLGIYREPPGIALQDKPAMKERLLELLAALWDNGQHVALATHDQAVIGRALELARSMNKKPRELEVQMLLGVPREAIQKDLIGRGITVRLYVPYGPHWYNYCLRRLENNPEMARMVLFNLLPPRGAR